MNEAHSDENDLHNNAHSARRLDLSLSLEFGPEMFLDANGEVNEDRMLREALDYAAEASRGEFETEISLIDDTAPAADADELVEQLVNGNRELLADAQDTTDTDGLQAVEAVHEAENGEQVILHYNFFTAYKSNGEDSMDEIDILDTGNGE
jgi:hypothetical protein